MNLFIKYFITKLPVNKTSTADEIYFETEKPGIVQDINKRHNFDIHISVHTYIMLYTDISNISG